MHMHVYAYMCLGMYICRGSMCILSTYISCSHTHIWLYMSLEVVTLDKLDLATLLQLLCLPKLLVMPQAMFI